VGMAWWKTPGNVNQSQTGRWTARLHRVAKTR